MAEIGRIIIEAIRDRDDATAQARLSGQVREIADRFPVPGCRPRELRRAPVASGRRGRAMTFTSLLGPSIVPIVASFIAAR